jgi:uncharacterized membrane protein
LIYINLNFIADFFFGIVWIIVCLAGGMEVTFNFLVQFVMFFVANFSCLADIFLFIAIAKGLAGPVVSIVTANGIVVGVIDMLMNGTIPSIFQTMGVAMCFIGVLVLSTGDMVIKKMRRYLERR